MKKIIALIQLYSVQVLLIMGIINSAIAANDVPWWVTLTVNILGAVIGMIVRDIPQPKVALKLARARLRA